MINSLFVSSKDVEGQEAFTAVPVASDSVPSLPDTLDTADLGNVRPGTAALLLLIYFLLPFPIQALPEYPTNVLCVLCSGFLNHGASRCNSDATRFMQ